MRRPIVLLSLCLLLAGGAPAAAQPDPDRLDLLDGEPIELTPPVQQSLVQLQEEWQQWVNGFHALEREPFEERVEQMISEAQRLGMRRLPELSRAASAQAVEAARQGDRERATWALDGAERLDPGRPETAFRRAQVARMEADWGTALIGWIEGYLRLFQRSEDRGPESLRLWIVYALLLAGSVWMAFRMITPGSGLFADLDGFLARRMPSGLAHAVAVLLLIWPVVLPQGLLWLLVYWSILLWGHGSRSERVVTVVLWLLLASLPVLLAPPVAEMNRLSAHRALDGLAEKRLYGRLFIDLEEVVERFPDEPAVVHLLADLHRKLQQWDISRRYYQRLLELEPENAPALIDLGAYYFYNNDFGAAVRYFRQAAEAEPNNVLAWFNLAAAYSDWYQFEESQEAMQKAQEIDDGLVSHYQDLAEETRIVTVDGGWERIPGLMERLRTDRAGSIAAPVPATSPPLTPWWTLILVPVAWGLAWGLDRFRRAPTTVASRLGMRGDPMARGLRVLLPGLTSLEEGSGGRAFVALAVPALCVTLPAISRIAFPLPPGAGQGELWGLAVVSLVLYFSIRLWWDLTQR